MSEELGGLDLKDSLTKKIGGLPGFAWVGIALAGVLLYKKYKGTSSTPATSTSVTDTAAASNSSTSSMPATPLGANAQWAATAANQLMASGSYSASDIQTALSNYLTGNGVTGTQQTILDSVLHTYGTPPEGVQPVYQAPGIDTGAGAPISLQPTTENPTNALPPIAPQAPTFTTPRALPSVGTPNVPDAQGNLYFAPAPGAPQINPNLFASTPPRVVSALSGTSTKGD